MTYTLLFIRVTGDDYDLIGFDPRGTSNTIPFSCNGATSSKNKKAKRKSFRRQSAVELSTLEATVQEYYQSASTCLNPNGNGRNIDNTAYMGTAFVSRDMMEIVNALNEDGKIRFYVF